MNEKQYQINQLEIKKKKTPGADPAAAGRAHIIPQRERARLGWEVIDHWSNFELVPHNENAAQQINTTDVPIYQVKKWLIWLEIIRENMRELEKMHAVNFPFEILGDVGELILFLKTKLREVSK